MKLTTLGRVIQVCKFMNILKKRHIEIWSIYNAFAMVIAFAIAFFLKKTEPLFVVFTVSIIALVVINRASLFKSKRFFGVANTITLIRYILIILSFQLINSQETFLIYGLTTAVILDFFDGKAARYFNESSFFGQYFDMEIDAFFVLLMCFYYYFSQDISWWILIPGLLRYIYRIYTFCIPRKSKSESKTNYGTIIAASFFVILLLGLITKDCFQTVILAIGSMSIVISFAIGFIQYHK